MSRIAQLRALQVHDSRGDPTLEVVITLDSGVEGNALVPSGKSKGKHEALERRDGDLTQFQGKGVLATVRAVDECLAPALIGWDVGDQTGLDARMGELDGTANFSALGANAVLGVSLACARAAANDARLPLYAYLGCAGYELPLPQVSIIGGGQHADNALEFQDFLILPLGAQSFSEAVHLAWQVRRATGEILRELGYPLLVGDGGGFAPPLRSNRWAIELVLRGIERAGYRPGEDVALALDVAANHFRRDDRYWLGDSQLSSEELVDLLEQWTQEYPLLSIEDPFDEDDVSAWQLLTARVGKRVQIVGDDLYVTHPQRLARGAAQGLANSILVKPNQIGTLTQTLEVLQQASALGHTAVISVRSGETEDTFIADLAVATRSGQMKLGSLARTSRVAKFNRLLRIEKDLGATGNFAGRHALARLMQTT